VAEFVAGAQHRLRARLDLEDLEQVGLALHLGLLLGLFKILEVEPGAEAMLRSCDELGHRA
jgi:hypothetical protein